MIDVTWGSLGLIAMVITAATPFVALLRQIHAVRAFERAALNGYDADVLAEIIRATNSARRRP